MNGSIFIDVGHGYGDPGCLSLDNQSEFGFCTELARLLVPKLSDLKLKVGMSAVKPNSLEERGLRSKGYDIFLSLHLNATERGHGVQGTESFLLVESSIGRKFGEALVQNITAALGFPNRGCKLDNLGVLRGAKQAGTPVAVLVEPFFIQDLRTAEINPLLEKTASAIAKSVKDFLYVPV